MGTALGPGAAGKGRKRALTLKELKGRRGVGRVKLAKAYDAPGEHQALKLGDGRQSAAEEEDEESDEDDDDQQSLSGEEGSQEDQEDEDEDIVTEGDVRDFMGGQSQISKIAAKIFTQVPEQPP